MAETIQTDPGLSARVRELVNLSSIAAAARKLNLAEGTIARLAGGLKVTQGTALLASERLGRLEQGRL